MSRVFIAGEYAPHLLPGWTILYISKHTIPPRAGVQYVSLVRIHVLVVRFTAHHSHIFFLETTVPLQTTRNCVNIIFRRVHKVANSDYDFRHVRPSVCMEQIGCNWKNFHEILNLSILRKSVEKIQVSLKSVKNNGYFTWRPIYIFNHISFIPSWNEKCLRQKL